MKKKEIVSQDSRVMHGTLVFAGTRVPVESLIQHLAEGDSLDTFLSDFPTVSREQVVAYLRTTLEIKSPEPNMSNRNIKITDSHVPPKKGKQTPVPPPSYTLEELLSKVPDPAVDAREPGFSDEVDTGAPVGREVW